ncbi:transcriptional regulator, DeoR family [Quadrisphaera granulorum]|uniref:Lactose phosphotransferase system repressor n=1 Tax=Quadrisphaera granulorum TaxID=317664 RepID=A0A315ZXL3_9ACTN|nr:DeoR/GlpR family DNA-binding transcription regulator [Quadrisphaera granulorum]PWJ50215.1 DeoR family transcriptional regulator [Quadrisphaera granulorum]SZE97981.1 transcriptional regulator, DeoR family [Quadrisphaera granulorum]
MYATERHELITGLVRQHGRIGVADVAAQFGVTTETVRRDLAVLEKAGLLRRVHGGAVPTTALSVVERAVADRDVEHADVKERIARAALDLVPSGGSIALDAGTTTVRLARLLPLDSPLLVVTSAVPVAAQLAGAGRIDLHLVGGRVRGTTQAAVGPEALASLGALRVDTAFVGTNGLTADHGLTTPDHDEAALKRALVAAGRRVVVLADASKLGQEHLVRFAGLDQIDVLVTDSSAPRRELKSLEARGVEVLVA